MNLEHFTFQFISFPDSEGNHLPSITKALESGAKWIQLRVKNDLESLENHIPKVKTLCEQFGATFILNDYPDMVAKYDLDGVHIGKTDIGAHQARELIGNNKILGRTCNTLDDLIEAKDLPIDYIGFGPYHFTTTKKNLSTVLGKDNFNQLSQFRQIHTIPPIVGIGGITVVDLSALTTFDIEGIAVSGFVNQAESETLKTFIQNTKDGFTKDRR